MKLSIRSKIIALSLVLVLLTLATVAVVSWTSWYAGRDLLVNQRQRTLSATAEADVHRINEFLGAFKKDILVVANQRLMLRCLDPEEYLPPEFKYLARTIKAPEEHRPKESKYLAPAIRRWQETLQNTLSEQVVRLREQYRKAQILVIRDDRFHVYAHVERGSDGSVQFKPNLGELPELKDETVTEAALKAADLSPRRVFLAGIEFNSATPDHRGLPVIRALVPICSPTIEERSVLGAQAVSIAASPMGSGLLSALLTDAARRPRKLLAVLVIDADLRYLAAELGPDQAGSGHPGGIRAERYLADHDGRLLMEVAEDTGLSSDSQQARLDRVKVLLGAPAGGEAPGATRIQDRFPSCQPAFDRGREGPVWIGADSNRDGVEGYFHQVKLSSDGSSDWIGLAVVVPPQDVLGEALRTQVAIAGALLVTAAGLALWLSLVITRPLKQMTRATAAFARGEMDIALPVHDRGEVGVLARTFQGMVEQVRSRTQDLRESAARMRAILDTASEGIITLSEHGTVEGYNQAAARIFGYSREEVKGQPAAAFLSAPHLQQIGGDLTEYLRTGVADALGTSHEIVGRRKDGTAFPLEVSVSSVALGDRRLFTSIVRDITERKRAEQEIRKLNETLELRVRERTTALQMANEALEAARDQATAANQAKSSFLAQMSHELRTPLNAIIGYSELLLEDAEAEGNAASAPDLKRIIDAGKHLLALINDILDLSKVEAGRMELCLERFDVPAVVRGVVQTIQPLVEKNHNTLTVACPDGVGVMYADGLRVRQVLFNLLSNACKFTHHGTVSLAVAREPSDQGEWVVFRVRDTGIGMTAEQLRKLFQPFAQADATLARKFEGTGLGLAISRRFCELMGGTIGVESEPGRGSTFTVRLPAAVAEGRAAPAATAAGAVGRLPRGGSPVLVVDDDPEARDLMQRYLAKEGFQVVAASGGPEALTLARQLRPTAITLDVLMPGMDGWSVLTALKADPELCHIPVVMLTILDDKKLGYALGAADYITKPVDRGRLADILKRYRRPDAQHAVLVVDDEPDTRELMRRSLEKAGWTVAEADNGRTALECLAQTRPALILLDLMMPEMDGFELLAELRQNPEWRSIPVVVVTAKDLTEEDRSFLSGSLLLSGHVKRVLQKGRYDREALLQEVRDLVAAHAAP
jgi:PAS domain S-box-containing protein